MSLEELIAQPIKSVDASDGLPIDAKIWSEAHNHHNLHRRVHALSAHRPGIVYGLEVVAHPTLKDSVIVAKGVGIDSNGETIILNEPNIKALGQGGQIYVVIRFVSEKDTATIKVDGLERNYRLREASVVDLLAALPPEPHLELARIVRTGAHSPVKDAEMPFDPGVNELNLLHRMLAFPHCYADASVGELSYVPVGNADWKPNRAGLWNLLREGNGRGFHLNFSTPYRPLDPPTSPPVLLYMSGSSNFTPLTPPEVENLRDFLTMGGLLFGEASGGSKAFEDDFRDLAFKLKANLQPVKQKADLQQVGIGDRLLSAHYMFSAPPRGAQESGSLMADLEAGVVYSAFDYGGAWQGAVAHPQGADARERIRRAKEFGLNVIAFAARRRRMHQLLSQYR